MNKCKHSHQWVLEEKTFKFLNIKIAKKYYLCLECEKFIKEYFVYKGDKPDV